MIICTSRLSLPLAIITLSHPVFFFSLPPAVPSVSSQLGEFWYQLQLSAEPAAPRALPEASAELGGPKLEGQTLRVDNPVGRPMSLTAASSHPKGFKVSPTIKV